MQNAGPLLLTVHFILMYDHFYITYFYRMLALLPALPIVITKVV